MKYGKIVLNNYAWSAGQESGQLEYDSDVLYYYDSTPTRIRLAGREDSVTASKFTQFNADGLIESTAYDASSFALASHTHTASDVTNFNTAVKSHVTSDAGSWTIAGNWTFSNVVTGVTPTASSHLVTKGYVDSLIQGLDWQESVIERTDTPPGSASVGDRYLVYTSPTGAWSGHANEIAYATSTGPTWAFITPDEGTALRIEGGSQDANQLLVYNGTAWVNFGSTQDHGNLSGLGDDDHTQYALLAGRSGGQVLIGGTGAGDDITIQTTSNGSKGSYIFSELGTGIGHFNGSGVLTSSLIVNGDITDGTIAEPKLDIVNSTTDAYVLSWSDADGKMKWVAQSGGPGSSDSYEVDLDGGTSNSISAASHGLGTALLHITVYEKNGGTEQIVIPDSISRNASNNISIDLTSFTSGTGNYQAVLSVV